MSQLYFFRARETKRLMLQKNTTPSVLRALLLVSFWVLSISSMRSQTAPNISYTTPQNYLLNVAITDLSPTNSGGTVPALTYKQVSTFAGTTSGFLDATVATAKMDGPLGMTLDANGDVYFIDSVNHRIRKMTTVDNVTTVTTIAGDGYSFLFFGRLRNNASGSLASFNYPADLALDTANNCLYVTDKENDVIRKVSLTAPYPVTTFAGSGTSTSTDNTGVLATFKKPSGIVIDPTGTYLYVTDRGGNKIRRITISTAQVTTIAGSGTAGTADNATGTAATFNDPTGIAVDADYIYITDFGGHKIRKISKTSPYPVSTIAGSGTKSSVDHATGTSATFDNPYGMTLDGAGNLFVAEWGNKIRKITPAGVVTTIAGSGVASSLNGNGALATFDSPSNIVINPATGIGYISEYTGDRIRKIEMGGYEINATPTLPTGISFAASTGKISGTPSARNNGPISYTITGYNYYGSSTATVSITTGKLPEGITTEEVYAKTATTATSGGFVNDNGISTSYTIEGGGAPTPLLEKGLCWSTSANPTISDSKVASSDRMTDVFTNTLTGLTPLTTYYVRAYATTGLGTGYGNQVSFTTKMQAPVISYNTTNVFTANTAITALQVSSTGGAVSGLAVPTVSTFAGSYPTGFVDGNGTAAKFKGPVNLATDSNGNVFVADSGNNAIRKITPDGMVSTLATGLTYPAGVATDSAGNVYVADTGAHMIRKITPAGVASIIAGNGFGGATNGNGLNASFKYPGAIAVDASGNLYVADSGNYLIRKITPTGDVTTLAGSVGVPGSLDGTGTNASFNNMLGIVTDVLGNVYVTDANKFLIRKITPAGVVTTLAGGGTGASTDGTGNAASFWFPRGVAADASGNLYVADTNNNRIRKITPAGVVTTLAGTGINSSVDGIGTEATFSSPIGITVDASGNLYVSESYTSLIRKISFLGFSISPALPAGLVLNADGSITGTPTVLSAAKDYVITATNAGGSSSTTVNIAVAIAAPAISYTASNQFTVNTAITALEVTNTGGVIPSELKGIVSTFAGSNTGFYGSTDGTGSTASFNAPNDLTMDVEGNVYVADYGNHIIRKITSSGVVTTFAGSGTAGATDGVGTAASFNRPFGLAVDGAGNVYVADYNNNRIRKITAAGVVTTFAGSGALGSTDGIGTEAKFNLPTKVNVDINGNVYVADKSNHKIRKITPAGVVTTIAGMGIAGMWDDTGSLAAFNTPNGVAVDASGNVYVSDANNGRIRKITPAGEVSTFAGSGILATTDGIGSAASFHYPQGVAVDVSGNVYVCDPYNGKIRKITPARVVTTLAGSAATGSTDGLVSSASFNFPSGLVVDANGNVYVADRSNNKIRKITQYGYSVSPALPAGLVLNADGSITGTPTVLSVATDYVITATNTSGNSATTIRIAVTDASATPTWTGTEWINGTATAATPAIMEGNYTSGGNLEVGELTIRNNATVVFQSGHNLTVNGKLTVESGSELLLENNANLVQTTNDTNSGLITIKRNTAPLKRLDYVLWSSPVTGQQLQSFSPATLSNRFYTYDGTTNLYSAVSSPNATDFEKGTGFLIRMPNDHPTTPTIWTGTFTGVPNNGYLTVIVNTGGYTALGNPYPSTMDADAFIDANSITEALYFWRKTNNSANPSYATYTKAGGVGTANSADPNGLIPNGVIQVGQGFIAAVNYIDAVFTNAMRTTNNGNQFLKTKKTDKSRIWLNLTNDSGFFSQTLVAYMDKATSGIDAAIDGRYFNDSKTALTSIIKNEEFTIQGRSLPFDASDVVPLGFKTETAGDFTLAIDHTDGLFATGQKVFLKDNLTNTLHNLSTGSYAFTSAAGVFNTRFEFRYQQALGTIENELEANAIVVYKQNDKIKIDAGTQNIAGVKVYDIGGRLLVERKDINANTALIAVNGTTQVLLVHVITQEGSVVIKKMIQ